MRRVTFVLGGARSGKSARALAIATTPPRRFLATAEALDSEMAERIQRHVLERGSDWTTIEEPVEISPIVAEAEGGCLVLDCLTLWLSNLMHHDREIEPEFDRLLAALVESRAHVVLVSNEVGLAIAPENALARRFRDLQGRLNQQVAAAADHVEFIAAGLPLVLKSTASEP